MLRIRTLHRAAMLAAAISALAPVSSATGQVSSAPDLNIVYPKHQSIVGKRVNVVLDPMTDWSAIPFFQVQVGGAAQEVIDTSTGRHALQGVALAPGMNTITVKALAPASKGAFRVLAARTVAVYNRDGNLSVIPPSFERQPYHTKENESACSGCHRLDVEEQDRKHDKPESVLCYGCHREVPAGRHIHGPAAVWDCLSCHDPDLAPAKYQFETVDPWQVSRSTGPVAPAVFTLSADGLFVPNSAVLRSDGVPAGTKDRENEVRKRKEQERSLFQAFLEHVQQNPGDRVLVEAHADRAPLPKRGRYRSHRQLTEARARAVAKLLGTYGVTGTGRITATGMGSSLPKVVSRSAEDRGLNDRIELVVHPPDIRIANSQKLPTLANRERVTVTIASAGGSAAVSDLKVIERLAEGARYVRRSGTVRGKAQEPELSGRDVIWALGKTASPFQERISFVVERGPGATAALDPATRVRFTAGGRTVSREFDPQQPTRKGMSVMQVCERCHGNVSAGPFAHGPTAAGYCTLCHDPHGSDYSAWTRDQSWRLCTTCHADKASGVHLIRGVARDISHPTRKRRDPTRPGKQLSCVSCHSPHGAETQELLTFGARDKFDLCGICHPKK